MLVSPHWRGHGLARAVVAAALDAARADGLELAMLFCLPDRAPLYARLGWTPLPGPVTADQPDGPAPVALGAMWTALVPGAAWPAAGRSDCTRCRSDAGSAHCPCGEVSWRRPAGSPDGVSAGNRCRAVARGVRRATARVEGS
ncbi:GNAT family N-acetyltransferase [Kitasatospora fiedleri]|uniref:GNAT family N-acetyltransferase n=1 Tax=Kitasatospora fiedleri TaxID=2991545 RepID=UPI00249B7D2F|nr:GNAT family N-acetyltransferase [Kitasatospora fiedleri]